MMMCIKVLVCIWPGVMISYRQDWISLKFIWHMTSNKTQVEFKREVTCQFGQEFYIFYSHDTLQTLTYGQDHFSKIIYVWICILLLH